MVGGQRVAILLFAGTVFYGRCVWSDGIFWRVAQLEKSAGDGAGGVHRDSHCISHDGGGTGAAVRAGMFSGGVCAGGTVVDEKAGRAYSGLVESLVNEAEAKVCYLAALRDFGGWTRSVRTARPRERNS